MQHIDYDYAKRNKIIGQVIYSWMQNVPDLNIHTKGKVIKDWREGNCCLNIGNKSPGLVDLQTLNDWTKHQINKNYHQRAYQSAYLKGFFKL
jgi:hypothetical protein